MSAHLVTGPGEEGRNVPSSAAGLSLAVTLASRTKDDGTFYVRNAEGAVTGRAERVEGNVYVYRTEEGR